MIRATSTGLLVLLFMAVGVLSWKLELRPALHVDASPLAALPRTLGSWQSVDVPLEASVESMLRADANVQRVYVHPTGAAVSLYIGYYGTERGGRPEHTPAVCYQSQGWAVFDRGVLDVSETLRVREYRVEHEGSRHLVQFWFRSHRRSGMLGGLDQTLDRLIGRLVAGRADGSLIRVSSALADGADEIAARSLLLNLAAAIDAQLGSYWPEESTEIESDRR